MFTLFKRQDWILNSALFALFGASLLMLSSISTSLFYSQIGWMVFAIIIIFILVYIDWRALIAYRWIIAAIYLFSILLLVLTYFFAPPIRNARSWLVIGPAQFQVSEFVKLAMIVLFAYFFSRRHIGIGRLATIIRPFLYFAIPAFFVFLQPDMGTVIILLSIFLGFLIVSGLRFKHIFVGFLLMTVLIGFSWISVLQPYQKERIVGLFQPDYDPLGVNYSTIQSKIAIGSGGFFGKGYRQGTQVQLGFLPEAGTDYIFASFAEEWGILGGLFIIGIFFLIMFRIIRIGLLATNNFYRFFCLGAVIMFLAQFTINMGSAMGLLPVIGITFPFLSYGGSSLLINAMIIGIVQSAYAYRTIS